MNNNLGNLIIGEPYRGLEIGNYDVTKVILDICSVLSYKEIKKFRDNIDKLKIELDEMMLKKI